VPRLFDLVSVSDPKLRLAFWYPHWLLIMQLAGLLSSLLLLLLPHRCAAAF
jgi:hypothetical protein